MEYHKHWFRIGFQTYVFNFVVISYIRIWQITTKAEYQEKETQTGETQTDENQKDETQNKENREKKNKQGMN